MKFKRGNKVRILVGQVQYQTIDGEIARIDIATERVGKEAIVLNSYNTFGEASDKNMSSMYEMIMLNTGIEWKWHNEIYMEFIEEGGEHLIEQAINNKGTPYRKGLVMGIILGKKQTDNIIN